MAGEKNKVITDLKKMKKDSVKEKILQIFLENRREALAGEVNSDGTLSGEMPVGEALSGEALAARLGVSRTAVWKAVGALRSEGYPITGTPKLGYRLADEGADTEAAPERFNAAEIISRLTEEARTAFSIHTVHETGSTNTDVREAGLSGEPEGYVLLAESQYAGRGRQGRSFYSPQNSGLYMSILLRPQLPAKDAVLLTAMAGVAAARAVESLLGEDAASAEVSGDSAAGQTPYPVMIKWVNDLIYRGHKICGILTEGQISLESGGLDQAVLGLGFNLTAPEGGWPEEIRDVAGGLFGGSVPRSVRVRLAAAFLNEFLPLYRSLSEKTFLPEYRARMLVLGQWVDVLEPDGSPRQAFAEDLDDQCRLLLRFPGASSPTPLGSGEVRVKLPAGDRSRWLI